MEIKVWCDPLHHLLHEVYKVVEPWGSQRVIGYETGCGQKLTVDDLNASNLVMAQPTCLGCVVATGTPPVIDGKG